MLSRRALCTCAVRGLAITTWLESTSTHFVLSNDRCPVPGGSGGRVAIIRASHAAALEPPDPDSDRRRRADAFVPRLTARRSRCTTAGRVQAVICERLPDSQPACPRRRPAPDQGRLAHRFRSRGVIGGSVELYDCDGGEWRLRGPRRAANLRSPKNHPQPVWFYPYRVGERGWGFNHSSHRASPGSHRPPTLSDLEEDRQMAKDPRRAARRPATKLAHLRKKMAQQKAQGRAARSKGGPEAAR